MHLVVHTSTNNIILEKMLCGKQYEIYRIIKHVFQKLGTDSFKSYRDNRITFTNNFLSSNHTFLIIYGICLPLLSIILPFIYKQTSICRKFYQFVYIYYFVIGYMELYDHRCLCLCYVKNKVGVSD